MTLTEVIEELRSLNDPVPRPFRLPTAAEVRSAEERHDGVVDERWPDLARWIREVWIDGG